MLKQLINNNTTDKDTIHSYLEAYEKLFQNKKNDKIDLLEIGVQRGGSIKLWKDYFTNGMIHGVDICDINDIQEEDIKNHDRVKLYTKTNAYNDDFVKSLKEIKFDFIIDDGPHTLNSMVYAIKNYLQLLKSDGVLIIEDIQSYSWIKVLKDNTPEMYHKNINVIDNRGVKQRSDDILYIIDLSIS